MEKELIRNAHIESIIESIESIESFIRYDIVICKMVIKRTPGTADYPRVCTQKVCIDIQLVLDKRTYS